MIQKIMFCTVIWFSLLGYSNITVVLPNKISKGQSIAYSDIQRALNEFDPDEYMTLIKRTRLHYTYWCVDLVGTKNDHYLRLRLEESLMKRLFKVKVVAKCKI